MLFSYIKQFFSGNDRCIWQICIINKYRYNKTLEEKKIEWQMIDNFLFFSLFFCDNCIAFSDVQ
jgi:hypothetical protein